MLKELTQWLGDLVTSAFGWLWDLLYDLAVAIVGGIGGAIVALVGLIPVPDVIANGLSSVWNALDGGIMFFASAVGVPEVFAMFGAAYLFRLGRKVVTLFQW